MKIALGSTSEAKKEILKDILEKFKTNFEILPFDVASEITDQPLDEDITTQGAVNRARNAFNKAKDSDFGIGLEGGLDEVAGKGFFLVCVAVIYDKEGNMHIGVSSKLQLPKEVSDGVKNGKQFGELIREYSSKNEKDKNIKEVVEELISRKNSFYQAITNAYLSYLNKRHFT